MVTRVLLLYTPTDRYSCDQMITQQVTHRHIVTPTASEIRSYFLLRMNLFNLAAQNDLIDIKIYTKITMFDLLDIKL